MEFFAQSIDEVFAELNTCANGLSQADAELRKKKFGANVLHAQKKAGAAKLFFSQFKDFMVLLLIAAAAISAVVAYVTKDARELFDTLIIVFIIFLNATVGFVQQYRADKAIEQLKKMSVGSAAVKRDGVVVKTDCTELVTGDVVYVEEGDMIPADCRIISSNGLQCDESALTGESQAVSKDGNAKVKDGAGVGDRKNMLFSSTFAVKGSAQAVVTATGMNTEIGKIAGMLDDAQEAPTPLQKSLDVLGKVISYGVIAIAVVIFAFGAFFKHQPLLQNFMSSVAIAVAAIPEGLPAVVTIIMAMGMQHMSRKKAIVRKLHAVETLGGCGYICSDKTGTLTQNKMTVVKVFCGFQNGASHSREFELLACCMEHCSSVKGEYKNFVGDPTEIALKNFVHENGFCTNGVKKTAEKPFDSTRKMMSVVTNGDTVFSKGAPDVLLDKCTRVMVNGEILPLDPQTKSRILAENAKMAAQALRVLGFAFKPMGVFSEDDLIFLGLAGMMDPPRPEALQAVRECKKAGVTPVMITGDHKETAFAVAKQLEIASSLSQVITGEQLDKMLPEQLKDAVERCRVYARVSPKHKTMIVRALQERGNVVAMTGDGINDAPSIKNADIGIAMGLAGTDVTKNASDMIIADDNFATIVVAVKEGRRIFDNIKKTICFFLATNLAEVLSIFIVSVLFGRFDFLLSAQLLWINLVTDSFPVLALGMEKAEADVMDRPPHNAVKSMFGKETLRSICSFGVVITVITLAVFFSALCAFGNEVASTMTFFTLSFAELFHAFNVRSEKRSIFKVGILSNKALLLTVVGGIVANVAICFIPPLQYALGVTTLTAGQWLTVFASSLAVISAGEIYKIALSGKRRVATEMKTN